MSRIRSRIEEELEKLATRRDELRVQLDLGTKELKDKWGDVDEKWSKLESYLGRLKQEGEDAAEDIEDAAELLLEEVKEGFKKIRELL
jgi:hypothetical protein